MSWHYGHAGETGHYGKNCPGLPSCDYPSDKSEKDIKSNEQSSKEAEILFQACQQYSQQFAASMIYEVLKAKDSRIKALEQNLEIARNTGLMASVGYHKEAGMHDATCPDCCKQSLRVKALEEGLEDSILYLRNFITNEYDDNLRTKMRTLVAQLESLKEKS